MQGLIAASIALAFLGTGARQTGEPSQQSGKPGVFDYYVLALSWSPEYCFHEKESPECINGKPRGFVVHGLWPQFMNGNYPEHCSNSPDDSNASAMLDIMPDPALVAHEWSTHGTCSGLNASAYFDLIRKAFTSIAIPKQFNAPSNSFTISPQTLKQAFESVNPNLTDADMAVICTGRFLQSIEICMSKSLKPMPCSAAHDCHARVVTVAAVR